MPSHRQLLLLGSPISPNVRAARLAFHEKRVPLEFREIGLDALAADDFGAINPFRKMPALQAEGTPIYETPALMVYADAVGEGAALEPQDALGRARMWQFIGVAQHQLYPVGAMRLFFNAVLAPLFGMAADPQAQADAVAPTRHHLGVLEAALADGYLAGGMLTHADLYCGAMVDYIARTAEGRGLLAELPRVDAWLRALRERPSFQATLAPALQGTGAA